MPQRSPTGNTPSGHALDVSQRYTALGLLCILSMITYLDRAALGAAATQMAEELGVRSGGGLKWAFTSFAVAYAIFELPAAWWGEQRGPRRVLIRIVLWWSVCTVLTGCVGIRTGNLVWGGVGTLVVVRFLFGAGEAGAYPNIARALHDWFPVEERGRAQGWIWTSGRLMGGITPLIWTLLVAGSATNPGWVSWRGAFFVFGCVGFLWCIVFAALYRDPPTVNWRLESPHVAAPTNSDDDRARRAAAWPGTAHRLPWRQLLGSPNVWLICLMYFCMAYGWYFHITYLPACLRDAFGLSEQSLLGACYKGGPLWLGAAACFAGGWITDRLIARSSDRRWARRTVGCGGFLVGSILYFVALAVLQTQDPNVHAFFLCMSLAAFCGDITLASSWAACQDIGNYHSGSVSACMNTIGTCGAATAGWAIGAILDWSANVQATSLGLPIEAMDNSSLARAAIRGYGWAIFTFGVAYAVAALCWIYIDPNRPLHVAPTDPRSISPDR